MSKDCFTLTIRSYEILVDPDARAEYDIHGIQGLANGRMGGVNMDASDLFSEFFGSSAFQFAFNFDGNNGRRRAKTTNITYEVTLEDLYNGKHVKLNLEKETLCTTCKGCVVQSHSSCFDLPLYLELVLKVAQNLSNVSNVKAKGGR